MDKYLSPFELIDYLLQNTDNDKGNYAYFKVQGKIP